MKEGGSTEMKTLKNAITPRFLSTERFFFDLIAPQDETASPTSNQTKIDEATDASDSNPSYGSHDVPVSFNIHGLLDIERDSSHVTLYISI